MKLPRRRFLHLPAGAATLPALSCIASAQAYPTQSAVVGSKRVVDSLNVRGSIRCCLASTNSTQLRLLGCCKAVPQPLQRMPEKHLARQGVFGFLCGLETVPGVVLAQRDL